MTKRKSAENNKNDIVPGKKPENAAVSIADGRIAEDNTPDAESETSTAADAVLNAEDQEEEDRTAVADQSVGANEELRRMMNANYLEYASYVIKDRAIPDVDDGLKPVQRRILWEMHRIDDGSFHKVANLVGGTMKFHPHGDASIEGALVYLANKELFIDKQGNFGSVVTGDRAAAARYIEARLSQLGRDVLFNDAITELVESYDARNLEPVRLPVKIPALLLMGASGLAPGTRTDIMPHNFNELLNAQIAVLRGEEFRLYPDFFQGAVMDASEYDDGNGKITLRAKIDIVGRNLVIREIPALTDTQKLLESIDRAINKNKIKIAAIHDLTAEEVCIEIVPQRGYDPQRAIQALYKYTDCSISLSLNMMVIRDNRPVCMSVSEVLRRNTEKLLVYLRAELNIEIAAHLDKLLFRTLARIFIEERLYKRIEHCRTAEQISSEVRAGLDKFRTEWLPLVRQLAESVRANNSKPGNKENQPRLEQLENGIVPDSEIDKLLAIPIRRISLFDIEQNRQEMAELNALLAQAKKNLRRLKQYAIAKLQELIAKYGANFPRRTEVRLEGFNKIDAAAIALNNIRVGWDKSGCYIGANVKSDDVIVCNEFDHLLCVTRKGGYKIIDIPDKIFIDRLFEFRKYDKSTVFGVVYSNTKTGKVYAKRTVIDKFIKDKDYRICPEHCRLELITPRANALYECRLDTPVKARQVQTLNLMDAPMRSPHAGGMLVFSRKILKITFLKYLDGTEEDGSGPDLLDAPPEEAKAEAPPASAQTSAPPAPENNPEPSPAAKPKPVKAVVPPRPKETAVKPKPVPKVKKETAVKPKVVPDAPKPAVVKPKAVPDAPKPAAVKPKVVPGAPKPAAVKPKVVPDAPKPAAVKPKVVPGAPKPADDRDEETWGISQPELGF